MYDLYIYEWRILEVFYSNKEVYIKVLCYLNKDGYQILFDKDGYG